MKVLCSYCQNLCHYLAKPQGKSNFGVVTVRLGTFLSLCAEVTAPLVNVRKDDLAVHLAHWNPRKTDPVHNGMEKGALFPSSHVQ